MSATVGSASYAGGASPQGGGPPAAVLDTNVALDVLAFGDRRTAALSEALQRGEIRWLASAYMRNEIGHVLMRPMLGRYAFDVDAVLERYDRSVALQPDPVRAVRLRCRDSADQPFLDLALAHRVTWLLTHDRDLLSLARHALRLGLVITSPMAWACADERRSVSPPPA